MSETPPTPPEPTAQDLMPANPRFSWPLRIFLFVAVFNMVFRSLSTMIPWSDWAKELDMRAVPERFSTREEFRKLAAREDSEHPNLVLDDILQVADSTWEYFRPWPGKDTRKKLRTGWDWGKYTLAWLNTRFDFLETVVGINQDWPMFSPNVSKSKWLTRIRLVHADGSERIVRQTADPEDLTNYSHWFQEKILDYELQIREGRSTDCQGYCNLLAYRHPKNEQGSPLVRIELFSVRYHYCPPGEDPVAFYRAQTGPPPNQVAGTFYIYDVAARKGQMVPE